MPIDPKKLPSALVQPGDEVDFVVPAGPLERPTRALRPGRPTLAKPAANKVAPPKLDAKPDTKPDSAKPEAMTEGGGEADAGSGNLDVIGPFTVLSVGNRLNRVELWQANQMPQGQENVLMVLVRVKKEQDRLNLLPPSDRLMELLQATNSQPLAYLLHPRKPRTD